MHDAKPFDRSAYLRALEPPRFKDGRREYVGRVLSADQWFAFEPQLQRAAQSELSPAEMRVFVRQMTDAIFPPPPWWHVRSWLQPRVSDLVLSLPFAGMLEAFQGFCMAQAQLQGGQSLGQTRTHGQSSSD